MSVQGVLNSYVRKTNKGKRGRPRKNKQVVKEESET